MATVRPEVTGRKSGSSGITAVADIGHNRGPPLDEWIEGSPPESWIELLRIVSLKEAARYSGLSVDTIKRRYAEKIIELSPRRRGLRLRDALLMAARK
jgi:hypothetical protein